MTAAPWPCASKPTTTSSVPPRPRRACARSSRRPRAPRCRSATAPRTAASTAARCYEGRARPACLCPFGFPSPARLPRARRRGDRRPLMTPTDCLASTFRPRSHDLVALALAPGIGVGGTGRPISRVSASGCVAQAWAPR